MPRPDQVIGCGLGRCIWASWVICGFFSENRTLVEWQTPKDFVRAYVMKAEMVRRSCVPSIRPRGFKQVECACYVGFNETCGAINRTVNMRLCREMHHRLWLVLIKYVR